MRASHGRIVSQEGAPDFEDPAPEKRGRTLGGVLSLVMIGAAITLLPAAGLQLNTMQRYEKLAVRAGCAQYDMDRNFHWVRR